MANGSDRWLGTAARLATEHGRILEGSCVDPLLLCHMSKVLSMDSSLDGANVINSTSTVKSWLQLFLMV